MINKDLPHLQSLRSKKDVNRPSLFEVDVSVSEMIEQRVDDQPLQEDDQPGFDKEGRFGRFMPIGDHSEQSAGRTAHKGEEEE